MSKVLTTKVVKKLLSIVDEGLVFGLGEPVPGEMCVEAAVCYAFGEKHGDNPKCVNREVSVTKIQLNDTSGWGSSKARAKGLRRLAVAQLGSKAHFSEKDFIAGLNALGNRYVDAVYNDFDFAVNRRLGELRAYPRRQQRLLELVCEDVVQLLVKMKVPGTNFLYLCGGKKRPLNLRWPAKKTRSK